MEDPDLRVRQTGLDLEYLKSVPGLLKIVEIICLLLAFACLSGFTLKFTDDRYGGRFDFFYFATITSWLLVIILFVMFLLRLYERFTNINWNLVMAVYSPVTAFLLLISSALVLDAAIYYRRHERPFKGQIQPICDMEPCGNVEAAGAFGIISMVLFAVDTILYCMKNRNTGSAQPPPTTTFEGGTVDDHEPIE
ncbi:plasmolipin-like [Oculina patagonica]